MRCEEADLVVDFAHFEWIVDDVGNLTHQKFIKGGSINGVPNAP